MKVKFIVSGNLCFIDILYIYESVTMATHYYNLCIKSNQHNIKNSSICFQKIYKQDIILKQNHYPTI